MSTSWESIIDSWSPWPSLMEHWEGPNGNRHRILEFLNSRYPAEHFASTEVFEQLINNAADLRASLFCTQPPKPASLANFSDVPVKQKSAQVFVDVVTRSPEQPKQPEPKVKDPWYNLSGPRWKKERDHNEVMAEIEAKQAVKAKEKAAEDAALAAHDEWRRRCQDIAAEANAIRPWR